MASHEETSQSKTDSLRLVNATIVDTRTGRLTPDSEIRIESGKIRSIGTPNTFPEDALTPTVDARCRFVVPGFLDMHVHSMEQQHPEDNLAILLSYGVTGIRNMAGTPALLERRRRGELDFGPSAPELLAMPGPILTGGNAETPEQGVQEVQKQAAQGADFIKTISVTPKTFFATLAESRRLDLRYGGHMSPGVDVAEASNQGLSFIEHLGGPFEMLLIKCSKAEIVIKTVMALRAPKPMKLSESDMNSLPGQLIVANPILFRLNMDPKAIEQSSRLINSYDDAKGHRLADTFAQNSTWHCPTIIRSETMRLADDPRFTESLHAHYIPASLREMYTKFSRQYAEKLTPASRGILKRHRELSLRFVKMFDESGVPMMTGSDYGGGWVIPGVSLHQEFDLLAEAGLTPLRILQMTTLDPARFLHRESSLGTVEEGKDANLVLLDGDPTQSVENLHKVFAVVRGGRLFDEQELFAMRDRVAKSNAVN